MDASAHSVLCVQITLIQIVLQLLQCLQLTTMIAVQWDSHGRCEYLIWPMWISWSSWFWPWCNEKIWDALRRQHFLPLPEMVSWGQESVTLPSPLPLTKHAATMFTIALHVELSKPSKEERGRTRTLPTHLSRKLLMGQNLEYYIYYVEQLELN